MRLRFGTKQIHNIFIDAGVRRFSTRLRNILDSIPSDESMDTMILTHADEDHIGGILELLRCRYRIPFHEVWMNHSGKAYAGDVPLSNAQNNEVYARLAAQDILVRQMKAGMKIKLDKAILNVLLPLTFYSDNQSNIPLGRHNDYGLSLKQLQDIPLTKKDFSLNNRNSIVFEFGYQNHRILFTGDAWADDIISSIGDEIHEYDLVKLPHHGAEGNISEEWPNHIRTENILICTDGIAHPDKHTIAKLIKWYNPLTIFSPSRWWERGFLTDADHDMKTDFRYAEGLVIRW